MQKLKIAALSAAALAGMSGIAVLTATTTQAQSKGDSLVERIASKFNLNKDEVQAVFDEEREAKQAERQEMISGYLQDKVDSGDLTADQKTAIENKLNELRSLHDTKKAELEEWAEQNGIDSKYLMPGRHSDNRLDDAVESGELTEQQRELIETKQDEIKEAMEEQRDELESWAEQQGISLENLMPFGGRKHHDGMF